MKILDAMACGLPVITPLFGGPTGLLPRPDTCLPVGVLTRADGRLPRRAVADDHQPSAVGRGGVRRAWASRCGRVQRSCGRRGARRRAARRRCSSASRGSAPRPADRAAWRATQRRGTAYRAAAGRVAPPPQAERSPYWLGLRVSVVIPTHNRKADAGRASTRSRASRSCRRSSRSSSSTMGRRMAPARRSEHGAIPFASALFAAGADRVPARRATSASSRPPASWCCSSATTSTPTSACSRSTCSRTPVDPEPGDGVLGPHRLAGRDDAECRHGLRLRRRACCSSPIR